MIATQTIFFQNLEVKDGILTLKMNKNPAEIVPVSGIQGFQIREAFLYKETDGKELGP
jgi:hypothetical protein